MWLKKLFITLIGLSLTKATIAQHNPATPKTFRITVNGIFPESPTEHWATHSMAEPPLADDKTSADNQAIESNTVENTVASTDSSALKKDNAPKLRTEPSHAKRGKAYTVNGKRYVPFAHIKEFSQIGIASWYGPGFHGKLTANGERFNQYAFTAAHKELPINSLVRVTRLSTGKSVIVRINDRGPFHANRILDLSYGAAKQLGIIQNGFDKVKIELIHKKPSP